MKKSTSLLLSLLVWGNITLQAQLNNGPISKTDTLIGFQDIVIVYNECGNESDLVSGFYQKGLRLKPDYATQDEAFSTIHFAKDSLLDQSNSINPIKTGIISDIGQKDAWFVAYNKGGFLEIHTYYAKTIEFADSTWELKDTVTKFSDMDLITGNNLHTGDLTGDRNINLVGVYRTDGQEYLGIFTFKEGLTVAFENSYQFPIDINNLVPLALNDFDNDGDDEIVIAYLDDDDNIFLQLFNIADDYSFVPEEPQKVEGISAPVRIETLEITTGDFDGDGDAEVAMAYGMPNPCSKTYNNANAGNCEDIRLYPFEVDDDPATTDDVNPLEVFVYDTINGIKLEVETGDDDEVSPLNLLSGNILNEEVGNAKDEIILGAYSVFLIQADNNLKLDNKNNFGGTKSDYSTLNQFINVANLDGYGTSSIVIVDNYQEDDTKPYFNVQIIDYTVDNEIITQTHILPSPKINCNRGYSIVSGFFSGLYFKIESNPEYMSWKELVRPVLVMNTPPAHFDVIDDVVHDVNNCFGTNDCESSLKYYETVQTTSEIGMTASSKGDWGFNTAITLNLDLQSPASGNSYLGVNGIDVSQLLGEDLGDVTTTDITEETETFQFKISEMNGRFSRDDAMLALISDYEKWKYTVTGNHGDTLGEIEVVLTDANNEPEWVEGRDAMVLAGYIPTHEQSNLLSYRNTSYIHDNDNINENAIRSANPDIKEIIAQGGKKSLHTNSEYSQEISWDNVFSEAETKVTNIVESNMSYFVGVPHVGGFDIEDGSIAEEETIETHKYEISEGMSLLMEGKGTEANVYEYAFIPYYYWSRSGALVIDYIVDLSDGSFWSDNYSEENPGFLFMNRLDSLKVKSELDLITDMDEYTKTTSIFTLPVDPTSGETIHVGALIHNLSLNNTSDSVGVKFYLGNPNDGGVELADTSGKTMFYTKGIINSQDFKAVNMVWESDFDTDDRIYCVIDPENAIDENNENDNMGWAPINRLAGYNPGGNTGTEPGYQYGDLTERVRIYPNPASRLINLKYNGPDFNNGTVSIYNINGQKVQSFFIPDNSGHYKIDVRDLPKGMYFLLFETEKYTQQSKFAIR